MASSYIFNFSFSKKQKKKKDWCKKLFDFTSLNFRILFDLLSML